MTVRVGWKGWVEGSKVRGLGCFLPRMASTRAMTLELTPRKMRVMLENTNTTACNRAAPASAATHVTRHTFDVCHDDGGDVASVADVEVGA